MNREEKIETITNLLKRYPFPDYLIRLFDDLFSTTDVSDFFLDNIVQELHVQETYLSHYEDATN